MHLANRKIFATPEEILECKGNVRNLAKFMNLIRTSGWLQIVTSQKARAYRKATFHEWMGFIEHGLWKTIERADERITIPSLLKLSVYWAVCEYKKLYVNMAQKTEDVCDAMEKNCDGELEEIQIPDTDPRFDDIDIREFLSLMEKKLSTREMNVFREIMDNETPLRELGMSLNISHERVRQLLKKAQKHGLHIYAHCKGMTVKECTEKNTVKVAA